ncbi:unnamed protein product [Dimorphilus gyrociliatus]|uniref:Uncharacterized protein n=1 Tax=Dimorphilus gyrociliatus TaxID=2664684 RepID=A0A7I8V8U4_9ANNE|nr:unnamed protein product [Dimorphilus gyrociliatus]
MEVSCGKLERSCTDNSFNEENYYCKEDLELRKNIIQDVIESDFDHQDFKSGIDKIMVMFIEFIMTNTKSILSRPPNDIVRHFSVSLYDEMRTMQKLLCGKSLHMSHKMRQFLCAHEVSFEDVMKLTKRMEKEHEVIDSFELKIKKYKKFKRDKSELTIVERASCPASCFKVKKREKFILDNKFIHNITSDEAREDKIIIFNDAVLGKFTFPDACDQLQSTSLPSINSVENESKFFVPEMEEGIFETTSLTENNIGLLNEESGL